MEHNQKAVRIISYIAGLLAILSCLMVTGLLIMGALGLFYPRVQKLIIQTPTLEKVYDGEPLEGGDPYIIYGRLHIGHRLEVMSTGSYTKVGTYDNQVTYRILDPSGADVTEQYNISEELGQVSILGRPISVSCMDKSRPYNGEPLISDEIIMNSGELLPNHTFVCHSTTQITDPGTIAIRPLYSIVNEKGVDVTDQYDVTENLGELTVLPLKISLVTESAGKTYDGKPLENNRWTVLSDSLLKGHTMKVECYSRPTEVGTYDNEAKVVVTDEAGADVSRFYEVNIVCGVLQIDPIQLQITTGGIAKEYDGKPLTCEEWKLTAGTLLKGDRLVMLEAPTLDGVGSIENHIRFAILDESDQDVSSRYQIKRTTGKLVVTPRTITIRTGSKTKPYDGEPLVCEEYKLTKGSLCEGQEINVAFTSIVNIGYTSNYIIDCSIYKKDAQGNLVDVTKNYSISYDYGVLKITAQ